MTKSLRALSPDLYFLSFLQIRLGLHSSIVVTFGLLLSLVNREGYLEISNADLSEKRKSSVKTIERHLKVLEENNLILRDTWREEMIIMRNIWILNFEELKKSVSSIGEDSRQAKSLTQDLI